MTKRKGDVSKSRREQVLRRDQYTCAYCGSRGYYEMVVDHVIPLVAGGTNDLANLTTACYICNARKGTRLLDAELREYLKRKALEPWPA